MLLASRSSCYRDLMPQTSAYNPQLSLLQSKALQNASACRCGHHKRLLSRVHPGRQRSCWQYTHQRRCRMNTSSLKGEGSGSGGRTSADIAALKGHSLSTVLSAHLSLAEGPALYRIFTSLQSGVKTLAHLLSRAGMDNLLGVYEGASSASADRDEAKKLDVIANDIIKQAFSASRCVSAIASEEEDDVEHVDNGMTVSSNGGASSGSARQASYEAVFDPLDGSRNIDAGIPTGTIFGIYKASDGSGDAPRRPCLQQGRHLVAAGYALFSSATTLVLSWGEGVHGFTLDRGSGEFVLTHPAMRIPARGQIYSVNDARYFDWPEGLRRYIDDIRQGKGRNPKQYSARYVCSLVADFHRTLLYGGVAMNPRSHLRLVYEANPLSYIAEQAGGKGSDGKRRILDIQPEKLHQRLPLFLGSPEDITELESYGDVQQIGHKKYTV